MNLPPGLRESIYIGGLLHDIGKIGISESVLLKPSKLTESEFDIIKQHPVIGYEIIKHIPQFKKNGVLDMVLHHHERYNGTGYPKGLKEQQIPLAARIMAVADSFDAMTSKRVYRENRLELQDVIEELRRCRGTQFDPVVADVFLGILEEERENILIHDLDASIKRPHYI
nr:HD-GYP domain-containing protein [Paenibacillus humicola]